MFDAMYYGGPEDFEPCNAAYLQLQEELITKECQDACDYIARTYGLHPTKNQIDEALDAFDINYSLLEPFQKAMFDQFDLSE